MPVVFSSRFSYFQAFTGGATIYRKIREHGIVAPAGVTK